MDAQEMIYRVWLSLFVLGRAAGGSPNLVDSIIDAFPTTKGTNILPNQYTNGYNVNTAINPALFWPFPDGAGNYRPVYPPPFLQHGVSSGPFPLLPTLAVPTPNMHTLHPPQMPFIPPFLNVGPPGYRKIHAPVGNGHLFNPGPGTPGYGKIRPTPAQGIIKPGPQLGFLKPAGITIQDAGPPGYMKTGAFLSTVIPPIAGVLTGVTGPPRPGPAFTTVNPLNQLPMNFLFANMPFGVGTTPAIKGAPLEWMADIFIVIDASPIMGHIDEKNKVVWHPGVIEFFTTFLNTVPMGPKSNRVGVVVVSEGIDDMIPLTHDKAYLKASLKKLRSTFRGGCANKGIWTVKNLFFQYGRPTAVKRALFLNDGASVCPTQLLAGWSYAKRCGVDLLHIGFGPPPRQPIQIGSGFRSFWNIPGPEQLTTIVEPVARRVYIAPIHGRWSAWSPWNPCSARSACEVGYQQRFRVCDNPAPEYGGQPCMGNPGDMRMCYPRACTDNNIGYWTRWTAYTPCSVMCGIGSMTRVRSCVTLSGQISATCRGRYVEVKECIVKECPVHGGWSPWSLWGICSVQCGQGVKMRARQCDSPFPKHGGNSCSGMSLEESICDTGVVCPIHGGFGPWSGFGTCEAICGMGIQMKTRKCDSPLPQIGGLQCDGQYEMTQPCDSGVPCPIHGQWSPWEIFGPCSVKCGVGYRMRNRFCNAPVPIYGGDMCAGPAMEEQPCDSGVVCPIDGNWSPWGEFLSCSAPCGVGIMTRGRICNKPSPMNGGMDCIGLALDEQPCDTGVVCPIDGQWGPWAPFTPCSVDCGTGVMRRSRFCDSPAPMYGGGFCVGLDVEEKMCGMKVNCPVHGYWGVWGPWGQCSAVCEIGFRQRTRLCNNPVPLFGGMSCDGVPLDEEPCDTGIPCPIPGGWSKWVEQGPCSAKCGIGTVVMIRVCDSPQPMYGGEMCSGPDTNVLECDTGIMCPIPGGWSPWGKYGPCSVNCGVGVEERVRYCDNPSPLYGGPVCEGVSFEHRMCDSGVLCPIPGEWSPWAPWHPCSVKCGVGISARTRICNSPAPQYGGLPCDGFPLEEQPCDTGLPCPVDGEWGGWSGLSPCSSTCGVGEMFRSRTCDAPAPLFGGWSCEGLETDVIPCDTSVMCPLNGNWGPWSPFTGCSVMCGAGTMERTRVCDSPFPAAGGLMCLGDAVHVHPCDTGVFCPVNGGWGPWSDYSMCSVPCGMGIIQRSRACNLPIPLHGGEPCHGLAVEEKACDTMINCPADGNWGPWSHYSDCSVMCGLGIQQRRRECNNPPPMYGGGSCFGSPIDERPCDTGVMCPVDGHWSPWSGFKPCSVKCGMGIQLRARECANPVPMFGGLDCPGVVVDKRPCDTGVVCPLNGGWSPWSLWAACSVMCGTGIADRVRECSNPPPMHGGLLCKGPVSDARPCDTGINCPIHGGWSPWGDFLPCSVACGSGIMQRHRLCDAPLPMYGGDMCIGEETEGNVCDTGIACPVDGGFGRWFPWSGCSAKCGDGMQFRTRPCDSPPPMHGGMDCFGDFRQEQVCSSGVFCPIDGNWSPWAPFTPCSALCGIGQQERTRVCDSPVPMYGGFPCGGKPVDVMPCDTGIACPVYGQWSPWAPWTECSASCDTGIQQRLRSCSNPAPLYGGLPCKGIASQEQVCNTGHPCPLDGQWSPWSDYLPCDAKCGTGFHSRVRVCDSPPPQFGGRPCSGAASEKMMCDSGIPCPFPGNWGPWSPWSDCSAFCEMGAQQRIRECTDPAPMYGGSPCEGMGRQIRDCDTGIFCPIDGAWSPWFKWTPCSANCGVGMQGRSRECTNPPPSYGGLYCAGPDSEKAKCDSGQSCPVDGGWTPWGKFGPCTAMCGVGMETRVRTCTNPPPSNGGALCFGGNTEDLPCDTGTPCPVHGQWTPWVPWSSCDVPCGVGHQGRTRSCTNPPPDFGGLPCKGVAVEELACDTGIHCPIHGGWSPWRPWSGCSAVCGFGMMEQSRVCDSPRPAFGGFPCKGPDVETQQCDSGIPCPIHGHWSPWSPLSKCSHMCGVGTQTRVRDCSNPAPQFGGSPCVGIPGEKVPCDTGIPCPVDGEWGLWSEFGPCSAKCGFGLHSRQRFCDNPSPKFGGADCFGPALEETKCDTFVPCAVHGGWSFWSPWSACTANCGVGQQSRGRTCTNPNPLFNGIMCKGPVEETRKCDSGKMCPIHGGWAPWTPWDSCNALCGVGMQGRFRECSAPFPQFGGYPCKGPDVHSRECKAGVPCPVDGGWVTWTPWSDCSDICGVGIRTRSRVCEAPPPQFGGKECVGPDGAMEECHTGIMCPIDGSWSPWLPWSGCNVKCGAGVENRDRFCNAPAPQYGGLPCTGVSIDSRPCQTGIMCPVNGQWGVFGPWTKCAADCGVGVQKRMRVCNNPPPMFGGIPCTGFAEEVLTCDTMIPCPIDGHWSPWSGYLACTVKCGFGTQERTRLCNDPPPQFGGHECAGLAVESIGCDSGVACPVNGNWSPWRKWSPCSVVCGVGKMERSRECNNPAPAYGGIPCQGPPFEVGPCDTMVMCPIHGSWGPWAPWTGCDVLCGVGLHIRLRDCSHPAPQFGGQPCDGPAKGERVCDTGIPCSVDGQWGPWSKFAPCSAMCGIGSHSRVRYCDSPAPLFGGLECIGPPVDDRSCDTMVPCPLHGGWTFWGPWTACTRSCGLGSKTRVRACRNPSPLYGGLLCKGPDREIADCDAGVPCPVDGGWGLWQGWAPCDAACGAGLQERRRSCDQPRPQFGGMPCEGPMAETMKCDSGRLCPVHGQWSFWSPWGGCSEPCGIGVSTRVRDCSNPVPMFGGYPCDGPMHDSRKCDTNIPCPVDGQWSLWSGFGPCSVKCGVGIQERFRSCDSPRPGFGGMDCVGPAFEDTKCDTYITCAVNGGWTLWSKWSGCNAKCGIGIKSRVRQCADPVPQFGGVPCDGPTEEAAECDTGIHCPIDGNWDIWSPWDACDAKCGFGVQGRFRTCTAPRPQFGGMMCAGMPEQVKECSTGVACPIHGRWSPWSHWDKCDVKCGTGSQVRMRTCSNPMPQFGGMMCAGLPEQVKECNTGVACPIHGRWSPWSHWDKCDVKCGTGSQVRMRTCSNPMPQFGGMMCEGLPEQVKECNTGVACPIHGRWSPWSHWDKCDVKCGTGSQMRMRTCSNPMPQFGGMMCEGLPEQVKECITGVACPIHGRWSPWSHWDKCDVKCGTGSQVRMRTCSNPMPQFGGMMCEGLPEQVKECITGVACPIHGRWSPWSHWDKCDVKCGTGSQVRMRTCSNPMPQFGGMMCEGLPEQVKECITGVACPIHGRWSPWSHWDKCDVKCGTGSQARMRTCSNPTPQFGGMMCEGLPEQVKGCNTGVACLIHGRWSPWSHWDKCDVKCGTGKQVRMRTCSNPMPQFGGLMCSGLPEQVKECNTGVACPIHGRWSPWSHWDKCDVKCGTGTQMRMRTCSNPMPQFGGMMCEGLPEQVKECSTSVACPIHGRWSPWSHWDKCDVKCGTGSQVRMRTCSNPMPQLGGMMCDGLPEQVKECITGVACPIHGRWSPWSHWDKCDVKCGTGTQVRMRTCSHPTPQFGGMVCEGLPEQVKGCNTGVACLIHGRWSPWSHWDKCDVKCGTGKQVRMRTCSNPMPKFGGLMCSGLPEQVKECNTGVACPIHGRWSPWSHWDKCDVKCGTGTQVRMRTCSNPMPQFGGMMCAGLPEQVKECITGVACPIHGRWSPWSHWDKCDVKCGTGSQVRMRTCNNPMPQFGGMMCEGLPEQVKGCNTGVACLIHGRWSPWSHWDKCDVKCGTGTQVRMRTCSNPMPKFGGLLCSGLPEQVKECITGVACPIHGRWSPWSHWDNCDVKCGTGSQVRMRTCSNPMPQFGGMMCEGLPEQVKECITGVACPIHGRWSPWSHWDKCDVKCGTGSQVRMRTCSNPMPKFGGMMCEGLPEQVKECNTGVACPIHGRWSPWSHWDKCDVKCGTGTQVRMRTCSNPMPQFGGMMCEGLPEQVKGCNTGVACLIHGRWSPWSHWDKCDVKCGTGKQVRMRTCSNPMPKFGGMMCSGLPEQVKECNTGVACPIHGRWSPWSHWDKCDVKCGTGTQVRMRTCSNPMPQVGGVYCKGLPEEKRKCDTYIACPIDGSWGLWGPWNRCHARCGLGVMKRFRLCDSPFPQFGGLRCEGFSEQKQPCDSGIPCSIDGEWSLWSGWSLCSASCGVGIAHRKRFCDSPAPRAGGRYCDGPEEDDDICDTDIPCLDPQDGAWSNWGPWQACTTSCGAGLQTRLRFCNGPAPWSGGKVCPDYPEETRICNTQLACPIHGGWSTWSTFGPCTKACIGDASPKRGHQTRYRLCDNPVPQNNGDRCFGASQHSVACDDNAPCGVWSKWKSWSRCDCQSAAQLRTRICDGVPGSLCDGEGKLDRSCAPEQMKADCSTPEWGQWSKWTSCSQDCGPGVRESSRTCVDAVTGKPSKLCVGPASRTVQCETSTCPLRALNCSTECKWDNGIGYAIYPGDCAKFVQCDHMYGTPKVQHCSWGLLWSLDMLQCVYPEQSECTLCTPYEVDTIKPYFITCRSYWHCTKGKLKAKCCPDGQRFDSIENDCVPDTEGLCNEQCPPTEILSPGKCIFKPSMLGPGWYEQLDAFTWIPRPCPKATSFSKDLCQCVVQTGIIGPDECLPSLHMTFDDLKSDMDRNVGIHIENVNYLGDGTAHFDGTGAINANIFSNAPWGSNVYVYIRFKPTGSGRRQGLVHNSGCGPSDIGPSLFMGIDREPGKNITMKFATVPERPWLEYDFVNVTTTDNTWIDAWFKFGDGQFTAEVDGLTAVLDIPGNVARRHGALNIGGNLCMIGNESFGGFVGTLDEVRIYKCKPHR